MLCCYSLYSDFLFTHRSVWCQIQGVVGITTPSAHSPAPLEAPSTARCAAAPSKTWVTLLDTVPWIWTAMTMT